MNLRYLPPYGYTESMICNDINNNNVLKEDENYGFSRKIPKNYI